VPPERRAGIRGWVGGFGMKRGGRGGLNRQSRKPSPTRHSEVHCGIKIRGKDLSGDVLALLQTREVASAREGILSDLEIDEFGTSKDKKKFSCKYNRNLCDIIFV